MVFCVVLSSALCDVFSLCGVLLCGEVRCVMCLVYVVFCVMC